MTLEEVRDKIKERQQCARHSDVDGSEKEEAALLWVLKLLEEVKLK